MELSLSNTAPYNTNKLPVLRTKQWRRVGEWRYNSSFNSSHIGPRRNFPRILCIPNRTPAVQTEAGNWTLLLRSCSPRPLTNHVLLAHRHFHFNVSFRLSKNRTLALLAWISGRRTWEVTCIRLFGLFLSGLIWDYGPYEQSVGLIGRVINSAPRPQPTQDSTNVEYMHTDDHASSHIRTHDPSA